MSSPAILRIPRSDEQGSFVLVHASQTRSKPLDLKLVGTDGLAPYLTFLRHSQASSLMVKNSPVSEDEWLKILSALLHQEPMEGMEAVASVEEESLIVITFRKQVRGVTQRLGTLELKHAPDEEIELFDWCGLAADAVTEARKALASAAAKTAKLEETERELRVQLWELVEAKHADEQAMLERFRDLLNEKKVKIREQLRLLADATVVPDVLAGSQRSDGIKSESGKGHVAERSRPTKRKVSAEKELADDDDDDDDDESGRLEKMDVDSTARTPARETSDDQRDTTDGGTEAETETASEGGDEDESEGEGEKRAPQSQKATSSRQSASQQQFQDSKPSSQKDKAPPPRRDLPFLRKKAEKKKTTPPPAGSETESDDEL
ncbi:hypothetical protein ACRALDRAFT_1079302 [Sodiomyces alcalophilus JCM 7366]|uniref:uncharacterized protein n=1 Tax=Sodiomyces alcalophilus JCM 7366 TaxID=591952 RepID=UPI0039B4A918